MRATISSLILFLCCAASAQLPVIQLYQTSSSVSTWYPTNASNLTLAWFDLTPIQSSSGTTDGSSVARWTNLVASGYTMTADGTQPKFYTTGGGVNGLEPRIFFDTNSASERFITSSKSVATYTMMYVCQISNMVESSKSKIIPVLYNGGGSPFMQYNNGKLEMSAGTTITGSGVITNNWYIITVVFNGASSSITTNGVSYVSGNAGAGGATLFYIDNSSYAGGFWPWSGNISRIWGWTNVLSAGDMTSAITQCKTDFGFP